MKNQVTLSFEDEAFVDQKTQRLGTTKPASYLFWIFFGALGVHRFYNGAIKTGIALAALHILGLSFLIITAFSLIASSTNFSTLTKYIECVEAHPNNHETMCDPHYEKEFAQQLKDNRGEDGLEIPVISLSIGGVLLVIAVLWWLIDIFLIPGMVRKNNQKIRNKCIQQVLEQRKRRETFYDDYPQEHYSSQK